MNVSSDLEFSTSWWCTDLKEALPWLYDWLSLALSFSLSDVDFISYNSSVNMTSDRLSVHGIGCTPKLEATTDETIN